MQVLLALHLAQRLLLPLQSLKLTNGSLEGPPQHRTSLGCQLQVLGPRPRRPPCLRRQARSPPSPTTTSTLPVLLVGGRREDSVHQDLVRGMFLVKEHIRLFTIDNIQR